ncbi:hypothetical protein PAEPH01_1055 [Pancytospora epiphaga]|nr:hypothetical protein PAEPH01_1055 [Pancytospora epiphaga]
MLRANSLMPWTLIVHSALYLTGIMAAGMTQYQRIGGCLGEEGCISGGTGEAKMLAEYARQEDQKNRSGANTAECNAMKNKSMEGNKENALFIRRGGVETPSTEDQARCMESLKKVADEKARRISDIVKENIAPPPAKKMCLEKLDQGNAKCLYNKAMNTIMKEPKTKIQIMGNVGEFWIHQPDSGIDSLKVAMVVENLHYQAKPKHIKCTSNFPKADLKAEWNSVGSVVSLIGTPSVPTNNNCEKLCGNEKRNGSTVDGNSYDCGASCDPVLSLLHKTPFHDAPVEKSERRGLKRKHSDDRVGSSNNN